jgi:hypothetical protein
MTICHTSIITRITKKRKRKKFVELCKNSVLVVYVGIYIKSFKEISKKEIKIKIKRQNKIDLGKLA